MITEEDDELDAVLALEAGAADHVTKPPRPRELTARIRAVLRRVGRQPQGLETSLPAAPTRSARSPSTWPGARPHCTDATSSCPARSSTCWHCSCPKWPRRDRKQCMDRIWRDRKKGDSRTLDTHVKRLRKKLEVNPAEPVHLITVGGWVPLQAVGRPARHRTRPCPPHWS